VAKLEAAVLAYRAQTRRILLALRDVASTLDTRPGRRAIALVSEGLFADDDIRRDLVAFSEILERARVVLFGVHLDFPLVEASARATRSGSRLLDDQYGFDAMAETAVSAGGEAIRAGATRPRPSNESMPHCLAATSWRSNVSRATKTGNA
jgi:hypothetical protein